MNFKATAPIYWQIVELMKQRLLSGEWRLGDKIPTVREIALEIGVNPNTVQKAVAYLENEGLFHAQRACGRYVTKDEDTIEKARQDWIAERVEDLLASLRSIGCQDKDILALLVRRLEQSL